MAFLLSRNPALAALRALLGLGLLAYGLLGLAGAASSGGGGMTPSAYLALGQCPGNPVPTDGHCYSVIRAQVVSTRQQLLSHYVTVSDGRGTRELELADSSRADTFQPGVAVQAKYLGATVTAVGVSADSAPLTSTVDSPLVHSDLVARSLRYVVAGLAGLILAGLPLLLHRNGRPSRRQGAAAPQPFRPWASAGPAGPPERAIYAPPVPLAQPVAAAPPASPPPPAPAAPRAPAAAAGFVVPTSPGAGMAPAAGFVVPTAPDPVMAAAPAPPAGFVVPTSSPEPVMAPAPAAGFVVATSREPGPGAPQSAPKAVPVHEFAALPPMPPLPAPARGALPGFTVLGSEPPRPVATAPAVPERGAAPTPPQVPNGAAAQSAQPGPAPVSAPAARAQASAASLPPAPPSQDRPLPAPSGQPFLAAAAAPSFAPPQPGPSVGSRGQPFAPPQGQPPAPGRPFAPPTGQPPAQGQPFAAPQRQQLSPPRNSHPSAAEGAAQIAGPAEASGQAAAEGGGPGWGIRQGAGPGPRQPG